MIPRALSSQPSPPYQFYNTNRFAQSLLANNSDESENADAQAPKGHGSDPTHFGTLQLTDHPVLQVLTNRVAKLEEATYTALTTATA